MEQPIKLLSVEGVKIVWKIYSTIKPGSAERPKKRYDPLHIAVSELYYNILLPANLILKSQNSDCDSSLERDSSLTGDCDPLPTGDPNRSSEPSSPNGSCIACR